MADASWGLAALGISWGKLDDLEIRAAHAVETWPGLALRCPRRVRTAPRNHEATTGDWWLGHVAL